MGPSRALALLCALCSIVAAAAAGRAGPRRALAAAAGLATPDALAAARKCRAPDARASSRAACAKLCAKATPAPPPVFYISRGVGCCACAAPPRRPAAPAAPPPPPAADYARLAELLREQSTLGSVLTLLAWDGPGEAELLPGSAAAAAARTAQQEAVSARLRALQAAPELTAILARLQAPAALAALDARARANVRLAALAAADAAALPAGYDARALALAAAGGAALEAARAANDWALFAPALDAWVRLSREYAAARRPLAPAYDALLDAYTPGLTDARLAELLAPLKAGLPPLLAALRADGTAPDAAWLTAAEYDSAAQEALRASVAEALGFDFGRGRLDTASSTSVYSVAPSDVRLLAAVAPGDPLRTALSGAWGAGFGAAQQGRRDDGLPASELDGVLERAGGLLFEDTVLSGAPGAAFLLPLLQAALPGFGAGKAPADLFAALNAVKEPPLSRLGADEIAYALHVILRWEIERALVDGSLAAADVPAAWAAKSLEYFGAAPPDDDSGALQDAQWAQGSIGAFPSYALGAMAAAQLLDAARAALPGLDAQLAAGEFLPLRDWLRANVWALGREPGSFDDVLRVATGGPLDPQVYLQYLQDKYSAVYRLPKP